MKVDIYTLAHEIKNPLAVARGYLEMSNSSNFLKYKDLIIDNIKEALGVLDNYLEYNKFQIVFEEMDLFLLLEEVIKNYNKLYKVNIELISIYDELYFNGDFYKLKQALNNIIKNSIEANANNIKIYVKVIDNNLIMDIVDDGDGINSFNDLENGLSKKVNGNGIGVIITKKIIKGHNGTIKYMNNDDKGCTVKIKLPLNNI